MYRLLFLISGLFLATCSFAQTNVHQLVSEGRSELINNDLLITDSTYYSYDSLGRISTTTNYHFNGLEWEFVDKTEYTYDGNGYATRRIYSEWTNNSWVPYVANDSIFSGSDWKKTIVTLWNGTSWDTINSYETAGTGTLGDTVISNIWVSAGVYMPQERNIRTYNSKGKLINNETNSYDGGVWKPYSQFIDVYDSTGTQLDTSFSYSDAGGFQLIAFKVYYYSSTTGYNDSSLIVQVAGISGPLYAEYQKYNSNGQVISSITKNWLSGSFYNSSRTQFSYNSNNDLSVTWGYQWSEPNSRWLIQSETRKHYAGEEIVDGLPNLPQNQFSFSAYPNPITDVLYLKAEQPIEQVSLLDMTGRVIISNRGTNYINTNTLPTGTYLLLVQTAGLLQRQLIVK